MKKNTYGKFCKEYLPLQESKKNLISAWKLSLNDLISDKVGHRNSVRCLKIVVDT